MRSKLKLSVYNKKDANIMLLVCIIGLLDSLKDGILAIDECEQYLFSPYSLDVLKRKGIDRRIIDIVHLGTELEDVESLLPERLEANIQELHQRAKDLLREIKPDGIYYGEKKWLNKK
ncbi:DUF3969 family protein [Candidatus Enterococcus murrayae]|uniref:DUF3969 family protein n=1 Tax=Candidatus Enterococcus murrayae TaxID=2815321 RepID=A0ABS3HI93_9ENTE|nr:DUF3969 family protein [Enterococcus sp. MJM16]MBO0453181.1 DUF3969 family protein [Enterococcus sp. MJM16]